MNASFEKLLQRFGDYSLPYLINLYDDSRNIDLYYVNDLKDYTYNETTYKAGSFSYTPNSSVQGFNGGGKLTIAVKDNYVINLTDNYSSIHLDVIGAINDQGNITEIRTYKHHYGTVKISKTSAEFTFEKDDRLSMTFPSLIWNCFNNKGNS